MPRVTVEPWGIFRSPFTGTVRDCLSEYGTGALRRPHHSRPVPDEIRAGVVRGPERKLSDHPTMKPQSLMRALVRASLPSSGIVVDPFAGSGATLAAASAIGAQ